MRVLVACEFSGIVRQAFTDKGHYALSCDLEPSETPGEHYQGDVRDLLDQCWDMMIAFPPCTYLCSSGARWWNKRQREQRQALEFVRLLMDAPIDQIAVENPVGCISSYIRRPDQIIHPWMFGCSETKTTCLWLKGLPGLLASCVELERYPRIHMMPESKHRSKERSRTYPHIALAMAHQWG